jgi:arsenate reductase (thioredoxin)
LGLTVILNIENIYIVCLIRIIMSKIIFVCYGNVGRSQMAEGFYNHYTNSNDSISGGTDPTTPHRYERPGELVIKAMSEKGIDISNKKVKYAEEKMLRDADEIYVLCKREVLSWEVLLMEEFYKKKLNFWNIKDPYHMDLAGTRKIRDQIEEKVLSIVK